MFISSMYSDSYLILTKIIHLKEDILYILASLCDEVIDEVIYFTSDVIIRSSIGINSK